MNTLTLRRSDAIRRLFTAFFASFVVSGPALAADIDNSKGIDATLDYTTLTAYGPWDDRNYLLKAGDLAVLADNEAELTQPIPAFFRVEMRREFPNLRRTGNPQYPRASVPLFIRRYGGLMQNGIIENDRRAPVPDGDTRSHVTVNNEAQVSVGANGNESTVEINPVNPDLVIGGANVSAGQEMYYSTDGGATWAVSTILPDTCCDPTVEWSVDGTVGHAAALGGNTSIDTWRSLDGGQTWIDHIEHEPGGRDKEWLHVDHHPGSPHYGNLYLSWHDGNVQKFRRNTHPQGELSGWQPIVSFNSAPRGIGSDMTTDASGTVYYFYGNTDDSEIGLLRSTDGGATFDPYIKVADTIGNFDFPIPSMANRRAWIYATTATDIDGPFAGRVYVSWTDVNAPESGTAANNHTQVHIAYSDDQGDSWARTIPHNTADVNTVDRWNQWMDVDEFGVVHSGFYDTRNSSNRGGVDWYYTYSVDGGATWHEPSRISSVTSTAPGDGQQFGDYNGISIVGGAIVHTWTDNRAGKTVYIADSDHPAAEPDFLLSANNLNQAVCSPGDLATITTSVGQVGGFSDPVTLAYDNVPAGFSPAPFTTNPVTPPGTSDSDVSVTASSGDYTFDITGTAGIEVKTLTATIAVASSAPPATTLISPADGSPDETSTPTLAWAESPDAVTYLVEIDTDPGFGSIDYSANTPDTSHQVETPLAPGTYYWRVTAGNPCGAGVASSAFSFIVAESLCSAPGTPIPTVVGSIDDTILLSRPGTITDLNVSLDISHTYVGDLDIRLTHLGTGTTIDLILSLQNGSCSGNDILTELDDEALTPVTFGCSPIGTPTVNGPYQPELGNFLSDFDGELIAGAWRLDVVDGVAQDGGTLDEWCLIPELDLPPPPDTDADGVIDAEDNCPAVANAGQEDVDGDSVGDVCDNCLNEPNADQCNTNAHEDDFGNVCDSDVDNNNITNSFDLTILRQNFGQTGDNDSDINCNGVVNSFDLTEMRADFGQPPGPTGIQ